MRMRLPARERVAAGVEPDRHAVALPRLELLGKLVGVAVGQILERASHERRGAVGRDLAQPHDHQRVGSIALELERHLGEPEDLEPLGQRVGLERDAHAIHRALIAGPIGRLAVRTPRTRIPPRRLDAENRNRDLRARFEVDPAEVERVLVRSGVQVGGHWRSATHRPGISVYHTAGGSGS